MKKILGLFSKVITKIYDSLITRVIPPVIKPASLDQNSSTASSTSSQTITSRVSDVAKPESHEVKPAQPLQEQPTRHTGWHRLPKETLPQPTYWPTVAATGVVFLAFGFVTSFFLWIAGLLLFIIGIAGWIGEIRLEQKHRNR